jgi:ribosomal protein S8
MRQSPHCFNNARGRPPRLPRALGGLGTAILATSSGLVTARDAQARGIGGEVICFVW